MPFRCINEPFAYCSGTPKATLRLPDATTGQPIPGFEYEGNTCIENYKTCTQYCKANARNNVVMAPTPVAPVSMPMQQPASAPVPTPVAPAAVAPISVAVPVIAPTPVAPIPTPTPTPEPEFESIFLRGF